MKMETDSLGRIGRKNLMKWKDMNNGKQIKSKDVKKEFEQICE